MKILFFTTAPFNQGGPGKWFYELSQQLENRGHTTYVITWGYANQILYYHPRLKLVQYCPFFKKNIFKYTNFIQSMIFSSFTLKKMIDLYNIDIIHSGGIYESLGASFGKRDIPLITTIHGDYVTELNDFLRKNKFNYILKDYYYLLELYSIYKTRIITLPSLWLFKRLKKRLKKREITIIPNGVTIPKHIDKYIARKNLNIQINKFIFLIITNFNSIFKYNAIKMVIESIKKMKNLEKVKFVVIGGKNSSVVSNWDKMIIEEAVNLPIEFRGFQKNVYEYIFAADILIHPSFLDNQPISILEAMACGRPVIASNVGGIPEIINNGIGGMILDNSIEEWANILDQVVIGTYDLERIGNEGVKVIEERFNWEVVIKQYISLYEKLKQEKEK